MKALEKVPVQEKAAEKERDGIMTNITGAADPATENEDITEKAGGRTVVKAEKDPLPVQEKAAEKVGLTDMHE